MTLQLSTFLLLSSLVWGQTAVTVDAQHCSPLPDGTHGKDGKSCYIGKTADLPYGLIIHMAAPERKAAKPHLKLIAPVPAGTIYGDGQYLHPESDTSSPPKDEAVEAVVTCGPKALTLWQQWTMPLDEQNKCDVTIKQPHLGAWIEKHCRITLPDGDERLLDRLRIRCDQ